MKIRFTLLPIAWLTGYLTSFAQINYADKLDQYMQAQVGTNRFNGNVLVAKKGQILYQKA